MLNTSNSLKTTPLDSSQTSVLTYQLNALSPLDGRYASQTQVLCDCFSESALLRARVQVEIAWFIALSDARLPQFMPLPLDERIRLNTIVTQFNLDDALAIKAIEATTNHDVKAVEYWLKDILNNPATQTPHAAQHAEFIHFACTSEDINNTSHALMLHSGRVILNESIDNIIQTLSNLAISLAGQPMLSRTHGQTASPTTVGKEIANVIVRLKTAQTHINEVALLAKMNGAVGNYNAHIIAYPDVDWVQFSQGVVQSLNLTFNPMTIQIEPHDYMARLFDAIARLNTILIDFNRDIWGYISVGYFKQKLKDGEIGSSTMPHKVNPIDFENAEGNLGMANAMLRHFSEKLPISRWQRDLTDSTVLRNMGVGFGYSLLAYRSTLKGLNKLQVNTEQLNADLNDSWEVLAEAIQTVMRVHGLPKPYEQLKALTRGQDGINERSILKFVQGLDLPESDKTRLLALTPHTYTGLAEALTRSSL